MLLLLEINGSHQLEALIAYKNRWILGSQARKKDKSWMGCEKALKL